MAQLLLVEDNAAAAALICQYMKALYSDHQITICATATDAFDWAGKHHIDLFILDIQLPDCRGDRVGKTYPCYARVSIYANPLYNRIRW
ncbi:MAG: response regulator [Oscillospiraceae bacterium]